jgi:hypothetical protein
MEGQRVKAANNSPAMSTITPSTGTLFPSRRVNVILVPAYPKLKQESMNRRRENIGGGGSELRAS